MYFNDTCSMLWCAKKVVDTVNLSYNNKMSRVGVSDMVHSDTLISGKSLIIYDIDKKHCLSMWNVNAYGGVSSGVKD